MNRPRSFLAPLAGLVSVACSLGFLAALAPPARADLTLPTGFRDSTIYSGPGVGVPVALAFLPGPLEKGPRILVMDQKGQKVLPFVNGVIGPIPPFGTITEVDWPPGERGCLSLAVDPRWPVHPYVYLHYTSFGTIHLVRYRMTGDLTFATNGFVAMDTSSKMYVLDDIPDVNPNHNGGTLRFGPDGMLYMTTGDDQVSCSAQDTTLLSGKVLRLDITQLPATGRGPFPHALITPADNPHASSPDEHYRLIYALGLRNPFRMHIDPANGAVFIADVGQVNYEEVNRITGPANLGWPWYEYTNPYTTCTGPLPGGLTFPIATLFNPPNKSIVSLGVYRAPPAATEPFPSEYDGDYFFADYFSGVVRRIGFDGSNWVLEPAPGQPSAEDWATGAQEIADAAVGPDGALWYIIQGVNFTFNTGALHRVVWRPDENLGVEDHVATGLRLALPRPNPMRDVAEFAWTLPRAGAVSLTVLDLAGRRVATLEEGHREAGPHRSLWDGRGATGRRLAPGAYIVRLAASGEVRTHRFVRVK
jgi:glucose/arabinose dehydrogenase